MPLPPSLQENPCSLELKRLLHKQRDERRSFFESRQQIRSLTSRACSGAFISACAQTLERDHWRHEAGYAEVFGAPAVRSGLCAKIVGGRSWPTGRVGPFTGVDPRRGRESVTKIWGIIRDRCLGTIFQDFTEVPRRRRLTLRGSLSRVLQDFSLIIGFDFSAGMMDYYCRRIIF